MRKLPDAVQPMGVAPTLPPTLLQLRTDLTTIEVTLDSLINFVAGRIPRYKWRLNEEGDITLVR